MKTYTGRMFPRSNVFIQQDIESHSSMHPSTPSRTHTSIDTDTTDRTHTHTAKCVEQINAAVNPVLNDGCHPPFIYPIAECVIRLPCCISNRRKRRRRRGKRGGIRVKIRSGVSAFTAQLGPCRLSADILDRKGLYLARRSWDLRYSCHVHITLHRPQMYVKPAQPRLRIRSGGVNSLNIRPLEYSHCPQAAVYSNAKMCLVNSLVSGAVKLGVRRQLPVEAFPACAVTRAQAHKFKEVVDLAESFLVPDTTPCEYMLTTELELMPDPSSESTIPLKVSREHLITAQREDPTLANCVKAPDLGQAPNSGVMYFWDHGLLMRRWKPDEDDENCQVVQQIVLPSGYRTHVLKLAHEHVMSGHLGVTKTYYRVSRYFYWPGIKSAVSAFCKACKVCQLAGKPNQRVPVAPLSPIPVMCEPFERLIIDCVGPLPKSKAGHQYMLTIMCAATRFPEAVPLRNLRAKAVVKELIKFCSTFGLPKVIQTDRGTNFTSKMFEQILKELDINHQLSSAYHPESQGAIERFHQTLKTMLRSYCVETGKDWDEGLPFLLFAVRETVQESLGYSPAELVFGHVVRGPLKLLSEQLLTEHPTPVAIPDYVQSLRQRLQSAREVAAKHLETAQGKMKARFDQKSVKRSFHPGDSVLALLPTPGSVFQAKFNGPYIVKKKVSDTNYIINTPDRRRKSRLCHINMLKRYVTAQCKSETKCDKPTDETNCVTASVPTSTVAMFTNYTMEEDGLCSREVQISSTRLQNSAILNDLKSYLAHLGESQAKELTDLLHKFPSLFSDVPGKTTMCSHDIDVGNASPIKQHPYRVNPQKRNIMKAEVEYMLKNGFAVPSQSPWSSPCLLVPKPDSTYRFCTDFRKVNNITKADSFPLPRMEDCVDRVGNAKFVTKLDLLKGYWQVPLTSRASEISAFVTPDNFLQYSVLAFGMRNAPATFQRLMYNVLAGVKNCEVYLDDVVIHSHTWTEHLSTLENVFKRFADASLTLNLSKCEFAKAVISYLGKQVGQGMVKPVEAKVVAILEYKIPSNKRELRRFLGMCGYYRAFCPNFSSVVSPLTDLLSTTKSGACLSLKGQTVVTIQVALGGPPDFKDFKGAHSNNLQTNKHTFSALNPDNEGIVGGENRERKLKTKSSSGNFCREASLAGPDGPDREMGEEQMSRKASAEPHGPACTWASHT
ncbi:unnamed protein product [Leuciscus chuanchicus]